MQFISNGPDIPEKLLRCHEEGRVVFFCGAGISIRAGLPDYKGLVEGIWKEIGYSPSKEEKAMVHGGRCDSALSLLEKTLRDEGMMRSSLARVLSRFKRKRGANATHKALLTLSKTMRGKACIHLVTTNCDRLFEEVGREKGWRHKCYVAPFLPVPRQTNWDGIVYLHGLLGKENDEDSLANLVMTSGDFGRAYLKERWAARFVTELFREFVVCFVGYSLDDPVMRYIADAIEADKVKGEKTNPIYMFVPGQKTAILRRSSSITCINYSEENEHKALHQTLAEWAKTYAGGIYSKESIVDEYANIPDPDKMMDDECVGRMIWALSEEQGICARRFALHDPVPSLNWASILMSEKGLVPTIEKEGTTEDEQKNTHPLLRLSEDFTHLDVRQIHLWKWLVRHIDKLHFVWMVLREVDSLHPMFKQMLASAVTERSNNSGKDGTIPLHPVLYRLWRLILAGHVRSNASNSAKEMEAHSFLHRVQTEELDYLLLQELKNFLMPAIMLEKPLVNTIHQDSRPEATDWAKICAGSSLCLRYGYQMSGYFIEKIRESLKTKLPDAFDCIESALMEGLDHLRYLDANAEKSWAVTFEIRSIEEHSQNKQRMQAWCGLIDLLRDAWLELAKNDREKARVAFERWIASEHSLFQRLALFTAKRSDVVKPHEWCKRLLANHGVLLWMIPAQREVLRLLATTSQELSRADFKLLATQIAMGPPSSQFKRIDPSEVIDLRDHAIWLRLTKMEHGGQQLPQKVKNTLDEISKRHPQWCLLPNQREEFLVWSSGTGDPDFEAEIQHVAVPEELGAMVDWLTKDMQQPDPVFDVKDNWVQICKGKPQLALDGLIAAVKKQKWNVRRISNALSAWGDPSLMRYGRQFVENYMLSCPVDIFPELSNTVALWCEEAARKKAVAYDFVVQVAKRIMAAPYENDKFDKVYSLEDDPIQTAINHPVGRITAALLDCCFDKNMQKDEGIPVVYKEVFSEICTTPSLRLRHGRVILVSRIVGLYYADENWVRAYLYPLLDWKRNYDEAQLAWHGFLWVSRPYPPIMAEVKRDFLATSSHLEVLKPVAHRYCSFLTLMGLWRVPGYRRNDYRKIIVSWQVPALEHCANMLRRYQSRWMDADTKQKGDRISPERTWRDSVQPFIRYIWPKDAQKVSKEICASFAQLVIATGREFPDALDNLKWALKACPLEDGWRLRMMKEQTTCLQDFPETSLEYLSIVSQGIKWDVNIVKECLDEIGKVKPDLKNDKRYIQLANWARSIRL